DGRQIGATLDRNGLRPARYIVTDDDLVIMGSECGCLPIPEERIVKKWRLQPGKMFLVDFERGRIIDDKELKESLAGAKPYAEWIERIRVKLDEVETEKTVPLKSAVPLLDRQQAFAYTQEDLKFQLLPMAAAGEEPTGSMGNDAALAILSKKDKTLYHYFKQLFAQVTNPAIDPIREEMVTSLVSFIGPKPNLLGIDEMNPPLRLEVSQPVLDFFEMEKIRHIERYTAGKFRSLELDITYPVSWGKEAVEARLASLCAQAEDAVRAGYSIIVISDRAVDRERVAIPALLALSAIHQHLVTKGLRTSTGLVVETGSAREVHHFALLGGYGAEAVHPYLALETLLAVSGEGGSKAIKNYVKAVGKGLKKVMSKMGISTYMSYTGAQIFEAVGLSRKLVDKYFNGTASKVSGIGVLELAEETLRIHRAAFADRDPVLQTMLDAGGEYAWRVRGEEHAWTPDVIAKLQQSARQNSYSTYKEYAALINDQTRRQMTLRGLFEFRFDACKPVPIEEVEPAAEIVKRFSTGAMSLGSISTEAHTVLAIAMNRIGGKSNTGEG
ncbi:MAG: glutamate synthase central domain-containing protein, partial [Burkholderiales bacterium]